MLKSTECIIGIESMLLHVEQPTYLYIFLKWSEILKVTTYYASLKESRPIVQSFLIIAERACDT